VQQVLGMLGGLLNDGALVVCEHEKELELDGGYEGLTLRKRYKYGKTAVTVFYAGEKEDE
jgi:16S rRNA G966 N2-methylase RsmD